jgi:two-component system chemotaxis response regulator CheY
MATFDYASMSALVVEDNDFIREMVLKVLHTLGLKEVREAIDGTVAIDHLRGGFRPDFIVCDIKMTPVDGIAFVETIRSDADLRVHDFPVIILTGSAVKDDVVKAQRYGVDAFLLKPVTRDGLVARIEQVLTARRVANV